MRGLMREFPRTFALIDENGETQTWTLKWRRKLAHPDMQFTHGLCHRDGSRLIEIVMGLSRQLRMETFLHEVLHAAAWERNFVLSHPTIYNVQGVLAYLLLLNARIEWRA